MLGRSERAYLLAYLGTWTLIPLLWGALWWFRSTDGWWLSILGGSLAVFASLGLAVLPFVLLIAVPTILILEWLAGHKLSLRLTLATASGLFLAALSAPLNWHAVHWIAYLPMFWVLREETPRSNRWFSYIFGVAAVACIFRWIADTIAFFSNIPMPGAIAILVLFAAVFGAPYLALWASVHPLRKRLGDLWIVAFPSLLVVIEWLSSHLLLFPYQQGVTQYRFPFTFQLASITGVWGLSWLVMFFNTTFAEGIYRRREGRPFPTHWVAYAIIVFSLNVFFGAWRFEQIESSLRKSDILRVAQIQSSMSMAERLSTHPKVTFDWWVTKSKEIPPGTVDVVIWSEGAAPFSLQQPKAAKVFKKIATEGQFEMIVGGGARERVPGSDKKTGSVSFNSVYFVDKKGDVTERYDKMVPLPFGEYLPFHGTRLAFLFDWIEGVGDFRAGEKPILLKGEKYKFATPICYEAILSSVCRKFDHPDLLVTVTNDAWFGDTGEQQQHAMLAAIRATELGTPLVRSGYTGVSFVVEPHGIIHSETKPFTEVSQVATVRMATFPTLYARFGNWFVAVCALFLVGSYVGAPKLRIQP